MTNNVLWLLPDGVITKRMKAVTSFAAGVKLPPQAIRYDCLHKRQKGFWSKKPKTKNKKHISAKARNAMEPLWPEILKLHNPSVIVINDIAAGKFLFPDVFTKETLTLYRGSVYYDGTLASNSITGEPIPFLVIDDMFKTYTKRFIPKITEINDMGKEVTGGVIKPSNNPSLDRWIAQQDFNRLRRYYDGKQNGMSHRHEMSICFDTHEVTEAWRILSGALALAIDIETSRGLISCIGFAGLMPDGSTKTFVVPFYNPTKHEGAHWETIEEERYAWKAVKALCEHKYAIGCMANGSYDSSVMLKYDIVVPQLLVDTVVMMHAMYPECRKSLAMSASITNDDYQYWKDDVKGNKADFDKDGYIPTTESGLLHYWNYNGLDCYHTLWAGIRLLRELVNTPWALTNYVNRMQLQYGPSLYMTLHGMKANRGFYDKKMDSLEHETFLGRKAFIASVGDPDFNPNSAPQKAKLFYDILGCPIKSLKEKRSTEEKYLRQLASVHPLHKLWFDKLLDYSKPNKKFTEYAKLRFLGHKSQRNERAMTGFSAIGTWTTRFNSSKLWFIYGRNMQNVPADMRPMVKADDGYILVDIDYSQSDSYFVAFESGDPKMIENTLSDKDTHAIHGEFFLGVDYDTIVKGKKAHDPFITDPITGIRPITKKVAHGCNYDMEAFTMLLTTGRESINAAAEALMPGCEANLWNQQKIMFFVKKLILSYNHLYPGLAAWKQDLIDEVANNHNLITNAFGMTHRFFSNPKTDNATVRQLSAFKGQSGTAGNINRSLLELFHSEEWRRRGGELLLQVHDSIVIQVPVTDLSLIDYVLNIMEKEITIKGRTFHVPAEADLSFVWSKKAVSYKGLTAKSQEDYIAEAHQLAQEYLQ